MNIFVTVLLNILVNNLKCTVLIKIPVIYLKNEFNSNSLSF